MERWTVHYLERIPYKLNRMRYHSIVTNFGRLKDPEWVEKTRHTEPSAVRDG
ncbi:MAG: hypothetical protein HY672_01445 [Chloroflexi bacterium]|nr:hypothetical protein [Chloroflexota bacterium]